MPGSQPSESLQRQTNTPMRISGERPASGMDTDRPWPLVLRVAPPSSSMARAAASKPRTTMSLTFGRAALGP